MKRMREITLLAGILTLGASAVPAYAQTKKKAKTTEAAPATGAQKAEGEDVPVGDGFKRRPSGLEYKIVTHGNSTRKPEVNDHIELNITIFAGDSILFDSRKMNNGMPVPLQIAAPKFKGDVVEGFRLMAAGDSAVFKLSVDSLKATGNQVPPWTKPGDFIEYRVSLVSVKTEAEEKKAQAEQAEKQKAIDEALLKDYLGKNKVKAKRTESGLYYSILKEGTGESIKPGTSISVNYTGMFMDGKKFDSNTDSTFHHVSPFTLEVGKGRVIKGWDEGLQLLKEGTKAMLYIPSTLAYGAMSRPGIPANSILIFEVEITEVQDPAKQNAKDDKLLQEYFAKNKIKATKTPSGLYYTISQKGVGENAKPGENVTMNYTGKLLDGKTFDSNTDPSFKHVQPFSFKLGQGMVIKGWDEGVQLLKMGSKGTFYIPSSLGYGPAGTSGIPPNSVLVFDVEVTGIGK